MGQSTIVLSKKHKKTCQELFELFYKKFISTCFITANRIEGANCGEWLLILLRKMMCSSIGSGTTSEFIANEFNSLVLKDKRLNKRAQDILNTLQRKLGSCIRRLFIDSREARQDYDFFSNPKVSSEKLINPHYKETKKRILESNAKYILAIQDQMRLNFHIIKQKLIWAASVEQQVRQNNMA